MGRPMGDQREATAWAEGAEGNNVGRGDGFAPLDGLENTGLRDLGSLGRVSGIIVF